MVIRTLDLDSGTETVLAGSKGKWSPRWSPDGRYILAATTDASELHLFDCKSRRWKPLASLRAINDPTWSSDGRFVHLTASTERGIALFRIKVADGKREELALRPEFEYSWSGVAPDGSPLTLRSIKLEEIYALDLRLP
jgi:Tol biopolymer transport system component